MSKNESSLKELTTNNDTQDLSDTDTNKPSSKTAFRCVNCCLIPLLNLKENDSKILINCSKGHSNELPLKDYINKYFQSNLDSVKCSDCKKFHENKKIFKFCEKCMKIFCKKCLKIHDFEFPTHETISIKKMDTNCCLHKNKFTHFCEICNKNICSDCLNSHNNHKVISLNDLKLSKTELKKIKQNIEKEISLVNEVIETFNRTIDSITKKFEIIVKHKQQVIQFKKSIAEIYENKDSNFQNIENINKLKFNIENLKLDNDMNELDVLFELFNYLNCIDYNSEKSSSFSGSSRNQTNKNIEKNINKNNKNFDQNLKNEYYHNNMKILSENNNDKNKNINSSSEIKLENEFSESYIEKFTKDSMKNGNKNIKKELENINPNMGDNEIAVYYFSNSEDLIPKSNSKKQNSKKKNKIPHNYKNSKKNLVDFENSQKNLETSKDNNKNDNKNKGAEYFNQNNNVDNNLQNYFSEILEKDQKITNKDYFDIFDKPSKPKINEVYKPKKNIKHKKNLSVIRPKIKDNEFIENNIKKISQPIKKNSEDIIINKGIKNRSKIRICKTPDKKVKRSGRQKIFITDEINDIEKNDNKNNITDIENDNENKEIQTFHEKEQIKQENIINLKKIELDYQEKIENKNEILPKSEENSDKKEKIISPSNSISKIVPPINNIFLEDVKITKNTVINHKKKPSIDRKSSKSKKILKRKKSKEKNISIDNINEIINPITSLDIINNTPINNPSSNENINLKARMKLQKHKHSKINLSKSVDLFDIRENHSNNDLNNKYINNDNLSDFNNNNLSNNQINENNNIFINKFDLFEKPIIKHRSNSIDDTFPKQTDFSNSEKINSMKFENGISCLAEINEKFFGAGNLIGDLKLIEKKTFKEFLTIREHSGTINSIFIMHDNSILTSSADHTMKKIILTSDCLNYNVLFTFCGYENYVFKGIELINNKIISCSWDNKLFLWEKKENNDYENSMKFNEGQRVEDILEISNDKFSSISDNELKIWSSENMKCLYLIKLNKGIASPNSLCKLNDNILIAIYYHSINIIDIKDFCLLSTLDIDIGNLSCITKLNDGSILIGEDINTDYYCIFYLKQYILQKDELRYVAYRKDKFFKSNKNNDKEIRALVQFEDGIIAQGVTGEYNGKDQGDIYFYN